MSVITCSPTSKSFKKSINNSFSTSLPNKNLKPKSVKGLINLPIICCVSIIKQRQSFFVEYGQEQKKINGYKKAASFRNISVLKKLSSKFSFPPCFRKSIFGIRKKKSCLVHSRQLLYLLLTYVYSMSCYTFIFTCSASYVQTARSMFLRHSVSYLFFQVCQAFSSQLILFCLAVSPVAETQNCFKNIQQLLQ